VWRNLPSYHLWWCFLPLCHALLSWKNKTKYRKRWYTGRLRQTMLVPWYCLDWVVPKGIYPIWRRSEFGKHKLHTLDAQLSSGTSAHTSSSSQNAPGRMIQSDLFLYWNRLKMKLTCREKKLSDYFLEGSGPPLNEIYFRSIVYSDEPELNRIGSIQIIIYLRYNWNRFYINPQINTWF